MNTPQIVMIVWLAVSGAIQLAKHGEARLPYNFWDYLVTAGLLCGLLYWGGFWG